MLPFPWRHNLLPFKNKCLCLGGGPLAFHLMHLRSLTSHVSFYPKLTDWLPANHLTLPVLSLQSSKTHLAISYSAPSSPLDPGTVLPALTRLLRHQKGHHPSRGRLKLLMPPWDPSHRLSALKQHRTSRRDQFSHSPASGQGTSEFYSVTACRAFECAFGDLVVCGISHPDLARSLHPTGG